MNSVEFWALPAWSRILFQCTTELKEYQEYPHGFSMDLEDSWKLHLSKASRRRWKDQRWDKRDNLGMPIPRFRSGKIGSNSQKTQPRGIPASVRHQCCPGAAPKEDPRVFQLENDGRSARGEDGIPFF